MRYKIPHIYTYMNMSVCVCLSVYVCVLTQLLSIENDQNYLYGFIKSPGDMCCASL